MSACAPSRPCAREVLVKAPHRPHVTGESQATRLRFPPIGAARGQGTGVPPGRPCLAGERHLGGRRAVWGAANGLSAGRSRGRARTSPDGWNTGAHRNKAWEPTRGHRSLKEAPPTGPRLGNSRNRIFWRRRNMATEPRPGFRVRAEGGHCRGQDSVLVVIGTSPPGSPRGGRKRHDGSGGAGRGLAGAQGRRTRARGRSAPRLCGLPVLSDLILWTGQEGCSAHSAARLRRWCSRAAALSPKWPHCLAGTCANRHLVLLLVNLLASVSAASWLLRSLLRAARLSQPTLVLQVVPAGACSPVHQSSLSALHFLLRVQLAHRFPVSQAEFTHFSV